MNFLKPVSYLPRWSVALLLCVGVLLLLNTNTTQIPYEDAPVITLSTETPEEKRPEQVGYTWKGQPTDPKRIIIPSIDVDGLIQNVGVDQNQQIAVPNNIHIAGWFVDSVLPAEKGLSIIDGHVNGRNSDEGIFKNLSSLKVGDELTIEFGSGSTSNFKVYSSESYPIEQAAEPLYSQVPTIERQLNLITCIGSYDKQARTYDSRHIVILEAI